MSQADNILVSENDYLNMVKIRTKPCWICGQYSYLDIPFDVWSYYDQHNMHIDDAWPQGSAQDKQLLRTGIHASCWEQEFPEQLEAEK